MARTDLDNRATFVIRVGKFGVTGAKVHGWYPKLSKARNIRPSELCARGARSCGCDSRDELLSKRGVEAGPRGR